MMRKLILAAFLLFFAVEVHAQAVVNSMDIINNNITVKGPNGNPNTNNNFVNVIPCVVTTTEPSALSNGDKTTHFCKTEGELIVAVKDGAGNVRYLAVDANGAIAVTQAVPTTGGTTPSYLTTAASTNATSVKGSAGQIYEIDAVNTTSTLYYLRLYNLSTSPTCSSATGFVRSIPIPHNSGAGGGFVISIPAGEAYGTGIAFCVTGGGASTDNTNAATGVYININYK